MIELPEAIVVAGQMAEELEGEKIASAVRGNAPHKFAFYSGPPELYERTLKGKTIGEVTHHGSLILARVGRGHVLALGGGGERIRLHQDRRTLPRKHHLMLGLEDGSCLTVTVQGWGSAQLLRRSEFPRRACCAKEGVSPVSDAFTFGYFSGLVDGLEDGDPRSVKFFVISEPGVLGVGNGYLNDILFRPRIHPRRRALGTTKRERRALCQATKAILKQAVRLGGRDTQRDLYDRPGRYRRVLDSRSEGHPCPECGTPIEKMRYLGGASYFCPSCQA